MIRISESSKNPFQRYGLKNNPFPDPAIISLSEGERMPYVSFNGDLTKRIKTKVADTIQSGRWGGIPLVGPLGSGKTRLLAYLKKELKDEYGDRLICVPIDNPGTDFRTFYSKFISGVLKRKSIEKNILRKFKDDLRDYFSAGGRKKYHGEEYFEISSSKLYETYEKICDFLISNEIALDEDISRSLSILTYNYIIDENIFQNKVLKENINLTRNHRTAKKFLKGDKIGKRDADELNYTSRKLSKSEIINYSVKSIINTLTLGESEIVFLFLDQFEKTIQNLSEKKFINLLDDYRSLIDSNLFNFSALFACTTESWFEATEANPSFADRFSDAAEIPPMNLEMAKNLVSEYIRAKRTSKEEKEIYPFTEDGIAKVFEHSDNPRDFLENCHSMIEIAAYEEENIINGEFVRDELED